MTRARELADLLNGGQTIATADNTTQLTLKSTDADSTTGPVLDLVRDSASPADGDAIGKLAYIADNDAGEATTYSSAFTTLRDASDGAEDGQVINYVITNGSLVDHLRMGRGSAGGQSEVTVNEGGTDIDFRAEGSSMANLLVVDAGNNHVQLGNAAVQYRSDTNGLHIGKDTEGASTVGTSITASGFMTICRNAATVMSVARNGDDGGLINFLQGGSLEGGISVSGTTVSYTGGHLSRWSQLADNTKDTSILKGTVMTNLDQMAEWTKDGITEDNEQLNCMAVSSVEGDVNVAGVFVRWDEDDEDYTNDMVVAMTGDMVIRIAQGTTVARGDLLMSAGDGTAKPQGDDIVRSKTIAKVTSTNKSHTYDDGSYLVPCVLMAC